MSSSMMGCQMNSIIVSCLLIAITGLAFSQDTDRQCYSKHLSQCWQGETCVIQSNKTAEGLDGLCQCLKNSKRDLGGKCQCLGEYKRDRRGFCVSLESERNPPLPTPAQINSAESSSSSIAAGILIPLVFVGVAVLFIMGRRYRWWERLRQPRVQHYDTALVGGREDIDDDPPIA